MNVVSSKMLSISEIRSRATAFSSRWKDETSEDAEAKTFWDEFMTVFGIDRRRVAAFEKQVVKAGDRQGFIDLFWPGLLIVEHKSAGRDLGRAFSQAIDYFPGLQDHELPRYVIVSDFARIRLYDLVEDSQVEIQLEELPQRIDLFGFISGYVPRKYRDEDPVNVKAAELMGKLHDAIKATGYKGHQLEVFLVRLLFCNFADDKGIFERDSFVSFLETKTSVDGQNVGPMLSYLFQILNTPYDQRPKNLDEEYAAFPYVNGSLFAETLPTPSFDSSTRDLLLATAAFDWTYVSPAVFGSMMQGVMDAVERRNLGAHYTSEQNILKVVSGLFLDDIEKELEKARRSEQRLRALHERISRMRFLDPSCGSGNFLIIVYKELRRIEIAILLQLESMGKLSGRGQQVSDVSTLSRLSVHSMFGIEIEEFPARIAEVALWLIDHIMNVDLATAFGSYFVRLPLANGPTIRNCDALDVDWRKEIIDTEPDAEWFILGNPPFIGSKMMTEAQRTKIKALFGNTSGSGVLDFVTGWYVKAAQAIQGTSIRCAFVSTNSISQGEQVGLLWKHLVLKFGIKIHFAHRTFRWSNEARGMAAVHCVIVGFGCTDSGATHLYEYATIESVPNCVTVSQINGYLVEGEHAYVSKRGSPISRVPAMSKGSMPNDGGNLIFTELEMADFLKQEPKATPFFRSFLGAHELLNGVKRYCLWLANSKPEDVRALSLVLKIGERVRSYRLASSRETTRKRATTPLLFDEDHQPEDRYLAVPEVSSSVREYLPMMWLDSSVIASNKLWIIPGAGLYEFGVLNSQMHMAWTRLTAGRLKSDFQYSVGIVYNNFVWPEPSETQRMRVEELAQKVLDVRDHYPTSSLADLYHPTTMPPDLRKAHEALDRAVDGCYRKEAFRSERERVEHLFGMYRALTEGFASQHAAKRASRTKY